MFGVYSEVSDQNGLAPLSAYASESGVSDSGVCSHDLAVLPAVFLCKR